MYVRVVRFTGVSADRMENLDQEINQEQGPPPGSRVRSVQILYDAEAGTAVVLQQFDSAEDMQEGERVFDAMDASETPGRRASVDRCELKVELKA